MDFDQKIKTEKRAAIRNRERQTHYSSRIGYFNPVWTDGHKFLVDEIQIHDKIMKDLSKSHDLAN